VALRDRGRCRYGSSSSRHCGRSTASWRRATFSARPALGGVRATPSRPSRPCRPDGLAPPADPPAVDPPRWFVPPREAPGTMRLPSPHAPDRRDLRLARRARRGAEPLATPAAPRPGRCRSPGHACSENVLRHPHGVPSTTRPRRAYARSPTVVRPLRLVTRTLNSARSSSTRAALVPGSVVPHRHRRHVSRPDPGPFRSRRLRPPVVGGAIPSVRGQPRSLFHHPFQPATAAERRAGRRGAPAADACAGRAAVRWLSHVSTIDVGARPRAPPVAFGEAQLSLRGLLVRHLPRGDLRVDVPRSGASVPSWTTIRCPRGRPARRAGPCTRFDALHSTTSSPIAPGHPGVLPPRRDAADAYDARWARRPGRRSRARVAGRALNHTRFGAAVLQSALPWPAGCLTLAGARRREDGDGVDAARAGRRVFRRTAPAPGVTNHAICLVGAFWRSPCLAARLVGLSAAAGARDAAIAAAPASRGVLVNNSLLVLGVPVPRSPRRERLEARVLPPSGWSDHRRSRDPARQHGLAAALQHGRFASCEENITLCFNS